MNSNTSSHLANLLSFADIKSYSVDELRPKTNNFFGLNPFDLFVIKEFIQKNNIKKVLEFGCGSTSELFDSIIGVDRTTYALEFVYNGVGSTIENSRIKFNSINLHNLTLSEDELKQYDMILIDSDHTAEMANHLVKNFLEKTNYSIPVIVHDFFIPHHMSYPQENMYYVNNLIENKKMNLYLMTDFEDVDLDEINKIKNIDLETQKYEKHIIPRCIAILTPNN
jgi:hypothetical protein